MQTVVKPKYVVKHNSKLVCMSCKQKLQLPLPCPAEIIKPMVLAFWALHSNCETGSGLTARRFMDLMERFSA